MLPLKAMPKVPPRKTNDVAAPKEATKTTMSRVTKTKMHQDKQRASVSAPVGLSTMNRKGETTFAHAAAETACDISGGQ